MVTCPSCGTANGPAAKFCSECGTPLAAAPVREERRTVTVLFADLAGFTARAEAMDPEDVRAFLHPWYDLLEREVTGHGGVVERHLGDGVMALFGAPVAHEDDPERAVRAALRITERLLGLGLDLHARLGINTGEVLFAAATGPGREDAVTGDAVNTAARLQAAAPVDGVVVGEATWRATERQFTWEPLPPVTAKGKSEPLPLWRPLGPVARRSGELHAETTPLVGRAFELETLVRLFERSRSTPSLEVVTIIADPGIGKSRLVRELARHVDALPELVTWRVGRCLPYGEGIGFWALGEIVKASAGILDTDDQVTLSAKLDAALVEPDPSLRRWLTQRLSPLVGLETTAAPPQQEEAFTAWRRFLESIAQTRPLVLIVEDLHWADDALVAFLSHLADNSSGLPILLVATARPELEERHPTWLGRARRSTVLSLDALGDRDMSALVGATLPGATPELVSAVLDRAAGSPLYAEQLAAMFRDRPLPVAGDPLDETAIPPTIAALLAARIDALPANAKSALLDASVVGKTFWSGAVAALGQRERASVEPLLTELARRELVRPAFPSSMAGEAEYAFVHALVRDVAYGELTRSARLARHRAAAAWITERAGAALGEDAEIVVAHLDRALELAAATGAAAETPLIAQALIDALLVAADSAGRTDAPRAIGHLRHVLELLGTDDPRTPDVLGRLGWALLGVDELADAITVLEQARALYRGAGHDVGVAALALPLYRAYLERGQTGTADRIFSEAEPVLRKTGGAELVAYLASSAQIAWTRGRSDDALLLADEALGLAAEFAMPAPYQALNARGVVRMDRGDRLGGERDLREAIRLAIAAGDTSAAQIALDNLGMLFVYSVPDAFAVTDEERAFAQSRGLPTTLGDLNRLHYLSQLGRWDEAIAGVEPIVRETAQRNNAFGHLFAIALRVGIDVERGLYGADPVAIADEARRFGRPYAISALFPLASRLANAQGKRQDAIGLLEEMAGSLAAEQVTDLGGARAAVEVGCPDLARRLRGLTVEQLRRTGVLDGPVAEADGDHSAARGGYETGLAWARTAGNVYEQAHALGGLGRCLLKLGETDEGVARLREARELWVGMKATPRIAEIDALLATVA